MWYGFLDFLSSTMVVLLIYHLLFIVGVLDILGHFSSIEICTRGIPGGETEGKLNLSEQELHIIRWSAQGIVTYYELYLLLTQIIHVRFLERVINLSSPWLNFSLSFLLLLSYLSGVISNNFNFQILFQILFFLLLNFL